MNSDSDIKSYENGGYHRCLLGKHVSPDYGLRITDVGRESVMKIDVSHIDLIELAKVVYSMSKPQGLGFLHYMDGELSDEDTRLVISNSEYGRVALSMDYINGRACKFTVFRDGKGGRWIEDYWYDHTEEEFKKLLEHFDLLNQPKVVLDSNDTGRSG